MACLMATQTPHRIRDTGSCPGNCRLCVETAVPLCPNDPLVPASTTFVLACSAATSASGMNHLRCERPHEQIGDQPERQHAGEDIHGAVVDLIARDTPALIWNSRM